MDCSLPGSPVHGILQARILEWVACPPPGDLPDPGIEPESVSLQHWQTGSLPLALPGKPRSRPRKWESQEVPGSDEFHLDLDSGRVHTQQEAGCGSGKRMGSGRTPAGLRTHFPAAMVTGSRHHCQAPSTEQECFLPPKG